MKSIMLGAAIGLIAASACAAAATAGTTAARQRVAITIKPALPTTTFVLNPLTAGPIAKDSGKVSFTTTSENVGVRDGQRIRFWGGTATLTGTKGTLVIRVRIDWRDAGNRYEAGWGTWKVVSGTGSYASVTGSGGSSHVWTPRGPAAAQAEGFLTSA
jgi:hypothetical protein